MKKVYMIKYRLTTEDKQETVLIEAAYRSKAVRLLRLATGLDIKIDSVEVLK